MSTVTTVVDEKTGEEKERLINKGRWKGFGPTSVSFAEKGVRESLLSKTRSFSEFLMFVHDSAKVPTKPPSNVEEVRNQYDQSLVQRLEEVNPHCDAHAMELTVRLQLQALPYSANMDPRRAAQPIHPSPRPRNPKVRHSPPHRSVCRAILRL